MAYVMTLIDDAVEAARAGQDRAEDLGDAAGAQARKFGASAMQAADTAAEGSRSLARKTRKAAGRDQESLGSRRGRPVGGDRCRPEARRRGCACAAPGSARRRGTAGCCASPARNRGRRRACPEPRHASAASRITSGRRTVVERWSARAGARRGAERSALEPTRSQTQPRATVDQVTPLLGRGAARGRIEGRGGTLGQLDANALALGARGG
jgi:hypothetical protein